MWSLLLFVRRIIGPLVEEVGCSKSLRQREEVELALGNQCENTQRSQSGAGVIEGVVSLLGEEMRLIKRGSSMVTWTSLGKPDKCSHDSLCMTINIAIECEEVSTTSTVACSAVLASSFSSSRIAWNLA